MAVSWNEIKERAVTFSKEWEKDFNEIFFQERFYCTPLLLLFKVGFFVSPLPCGILSYFFLFSEKKKK